MSKRRLIRKLEELSGIKRVQCDQALSDVQTAKRSKERAQEIRLDVTRERDGAADKWETSLKAAEFSPEMMQHRAALLLQKEQQLDQADELVAFADQRLNNNEKSWLLAELQHQLVRDLEREANRKYRKRIQEKDLGDAADRFGNRSHDNGR